MSLAGLRELFVVSSASSAIFRGRLPDPREVGRALGVRYALLGRLRPMPGGYGVSVQLCDTRSGATLWGERLRMDADAIFDMQDEIVRRVVAEPRTTGAHSGAAAGNAKTAREPDRLRPCSARALHDEQPGPGHFRPRARLPDGGDGGRARFRSARRLGGALAQRAHRAGLVAEPGRGCGTGAGTCHPRRGHRPGERAGPRHPWPYQHDPAAGQQCRSRLLSRRARGLPEPPTRLDAVERDAGLSRGGDRGVTPRRTGTATLTA